MLVVLWYGYLKSKFTIKTTSWKMIISFLLALSLVCCIYIWYFGQYWYWQPCMITALQPVIWWSPNGQEMSFPTFKEVITKLPFTQITTKTKVKWRVFDNEIIDCNDEKFATMKRFFRNSSLCYIISDVILRITVKGYLQYFNKASVH